MPDNKSDKLPSEITQQLPEHAQQIFRAAVESAQSDGMDENAAMQVGWSSVKQQYVQGEDGKWHHKVEDAAVHNKSTVSGGN